MSQRFYASSGTLLINTSAFASGSISFGGTVNGAGALSLSAGTGRSLSQEPSEAPRRLLLSRRPRPEPEPSTVNNSIATGTLLGAISLTSPTSISLASNLVTAGGLITLTGPVALTSAVILNSTSAGGSANIQVTGAITSSSPQALTFTPGSTSGVILGQFRRHVGQSPRERDLYQWQCLEFKAAIFM